MNCPKYMELEETQKALYVGMLIHCVQSDDTLFDLGQSIIDMGKLRGVFDRVKIGNEEVFSPENNGYDNTKPL